MELTGRSLIKQLELETELKKEEFKLFKLLDEREIEIFKRNNVIVAGGAITSIFSNAKVNDIDCYFRCKADYENTLKELTSKTCNKKFQTANAITLLSNRTNMNIQLIHLDDYMRETPSEIYSQFDFTICHGAYDFKTSSFDLSDSFLKHLAQRALVFNLEAKHPINSLFRVDKFKQRGYTISKCEYFKVIIALTRIKMNTYGDMLKHLNAVSSSTHARLRNEITEKKLEFEPFTVETFMEILHTIEMDYLGASNEVCVDELPF